MQTYLTQVVRPVRTLMCTLDWSDRIWTFWLYLVLSFATLVALVVPWAAVLHYSLRLLGLAALGPHMAYVGVIVDRRRAEKREMEARYAAADEEGQQTMLTELKEKLLAEANAEIAKHDAEQALRDEASIAKLSFLESDESYNLLLRDSRSSSHIKVRSVPVATVVVPAAASEPTSQRVARALPSVATSITSRIHDLSDAATHSMGPLWEDYTVYLRYC